ncbi:MAG: succinylglutamate desuccinylase/aspartoacylase family protein [Saprospiraceae bacterium]
MTNNQIPYKNDLTKGIQIDDTLVLPGHQAIVKINAGRLPTDNKINVLAHVFNSGVDGPVLLVMAGVHGDEINGIEIIRRAIENKYFDQLNLGGVVVIPLLNVYGFINFSRDVSDGKDVNRSFPGHLKGSLAARIARIVSLKILPVIDVAIDFHTGGNERYNYPQVRYNPADNRSCLIAEAFGAPIMMESTMILKSFRKTAFEQKVPAIVYEGGESVRLDALSIDIGLQGIQNVLSYLGIKQYKEVPLKSTAYLVEKSRWLRSSVAGMFLWYKRSGDIVAKNDVLGIVNDPYGTKTVKVISKINGIIIGHNNASVVYPGDPLFHIGSLYQSINLNADQTF